VRLLKSMADHATKRAPLGPDDRESANGGDPLEELRHLIIAPEQEDLAKLHDRIENPELRVQDVSAVLPEAIRLRREQDGEEALGEALTPSVELALRDSVRKDPGTLADALFPVMGPAIRRSILQTLRALFDSFNQTMEQSLSLRGLKWRFEALRTGRSFSEVVLMHSLLFRVEQVFLIHKKTGLPLAHIVAPAVAIQDPGLVSGMLSAIQNFVHDSFNSPQGEGVEKLNVGELEVWVEDGPYAILAAVIRGMAPPDFRSTMVETLELLHRKFSTAMERFDGETAPIASAVDDLSACLDSRYKEKPIARPKPYVLVFVSVLALLAVGWLSVRWWQDHQWGRFVDSLRAQPGIVVTSFERQGGRFAISGLRDPLSSDPQLLARSAGLDTRKAEFHWASYYALDDAIVQQRSNSLLLPPSGVKLSAQNGVLHVEGQAPSIWIADLNAKAPLLAGVREVDPSRLVDENQAASDRLKKTLEQQVIEFPVGGAETSEAERQSLHELGAKINGLLQTNPAVQHGLLLTIIGHSDSTGPEATNVPLSKLRAERVRSILLGEGLPKELLVAKGVASSEPLQSETTEQARQINRSVTFRVTLRPTPHS
jgi:outer membrane protein OmpA-like peptidoglycan-associated protein